MHISEGVLNPPILIGGAVLSFAFIAYAIKKLKYEDIPLVAVFCAFFFIASFIHVPIGPASMHLTLNGIIGAILGIRVFIAVFIALFLQGLLFGYGGLSTLGINTFNLAFPALLASFIMYIHVNNSHLQKLKYFAIGFFPLALSALFLSLTLALNDENFISAAKLIFSANIPVMFIEAIITMFTLLFLYKVYPKIFKNFS